MKRIFRFVFTVALVGLALVIGNILGGDAWGIGEYTGLVDEKGEITEDSVDKFMDNAQEAVEEGKEMVKEAIKPTNTPEPTPHPYTTVSEIEIAVGRSEFTFFGEPCSGADELEKKITEAHALNPNVVFYINYKIATEETYEIVDKVVKNQVKANNIKIREDFGD